MRKFFVRTPQNSFNVFYDYGFIDREFVRTDYSLFFEMCKKGCKNFNNKYSCPPFSPKFCEIEKDKNGLFIVIFFVNLEEIESTEYNKLRIANVVIKSRIENLMRFLEDKFDIVFLSTGSCRLCKPCKIKLKLPCKYPDKKRYSLEATGVDCDALVNSLFKRKLLWYKNRLSPKYTSVVCGLFCNKNDSKNLILNTEKYIQQNYSFPKPAKTPSRVQESWQ